jgi:hypothetical protein
LIGPFLDALGNLATELHARLRLQGVVIDSQDAECVQAVLVPRCGRLNGF